MNRKMKVAEQFLRSLEDPNHSGQAMTDSIDNSLLYVMNSYANTISKTKSNIDINDSDMITSAMLIGYLLKSHMDRYELEKAFNCQPVDADYNSI